MSATASIRTALVTGASGFLGSHLTRRLVREGWDVHVIVRPTSDLNLLADIKDEITVHRHDGATQCMIELMRGVTPDTVFHLASLFLAAHTHADILPLICSNIAFGTQLVEAMAVTGSTKIVNTGTTWQQYESASYRPVCLYAATKQAFEAVLTYYVDAAELNVVTLRLPDTYGEGDPRRKLITLLNEAAATGETLNMSPGGQLIDLVHVADVVDAYMAAARLLDLGTDGHSRYLVTSGNPLRLRDLLAVYEEANDDTLSVRWGARPYRAREVMIPCQAGDRLPGWRPRIPLIDGLKRSVA